MESEPSNLGEEINYQKYQEGKSVFKYIKYVAITISWYFINKKGPNWLKSEVLHIRLYKPRGKLRLYHSPNLVFVLL